MNLKVGERVTCEEKKDRWISVCSIGPKELKITMCIGHEGNLERTIVLNKERAMALAALMLNIANELEL